MPTCFANIDHKWSIAHYLTHTNLPRPLFDEEEDHPTSTTAAPFMKEEVLHDSTITSVLKQMLKSEMELVSQFLLLDERNFHCWNYRRFIVALLGTTTITATTTTTTQEDVSTATATNDAASLSSL